MGDRETVSHWEDGEEVTLTEEGYVTLEDDEDYDRVNEVLQGDDRNYGYESYGR